jgi:pimeloyl-ACP methyl ester carboxylesterase
MRIDSRLRRDGVGSEDRAEGMAWVDERARRLRAGESAEQVVAAQLGFAGKPWYEVVSLATATPATTEFFARSMDIDPAELLPKLRCPVLTLFGGADDAVPVETSVARIAAARPETGVEVFPGADHSLFVDGALAPGFLPKLTAFLKQPA